MLSFSLIIGTEAVFNALNWKSILDSVGVKTTLRRSLNLSWVGFFLDALIPGGVSGDIFIIYLLSRDEGVDGVKVVASIVIKDILEFIVVLITLILSIILLVFSFSIGSVLFFTIGLIMILLSLPLILIIYLSTNVSVTKRLLKFLVRVIAKVRHREPNNEFENKLESQITHLHNVIMIMKNKPKTMVKPMFYQVMSLHLRHLSPILCVCCFGEHRRIKQNSPNKQHRKQHQKSRCGSCWIFPNTFQSALSCSWH